MHIAENEETIFKIEKVGVTFRTIKAEFGDINLDISNKNVLSLPLRGYRLQPENFPDQKAFHRGINDVYDFFTASDDIQFDVYADEEEISYLSLHSDTFWLGTFLLTGVATPFFINLLTSYIYDKLKAKKEDEISIDVIVDQGEDKSTAVRYKGKVADFDKAIEAIRKLND